MRTALTKRYHQIQAYYADEAMSGFMTRGDSRLLGSSILALIAFFIIVAISEG